MLLVLLCYNKGPVVLVMLAIRLSMLVYMHVTVELHATTQGSVWSHLYVCFDVRHQRHAVILVAADAWPAPHSMTILDHPM